MDANLLKRITERISNDSDLRRFLEANRNLSETQELLLSYYLDNKLSISDAEDLMEISSNFNGNRLDRIVKLIKGGVETQEAEAIIWLEDNGFNKVIDDKVLAKASSDKENNTDYIYRRVKDRLSHIIEEEKNFSSETCAILEFLNITKGDSNFEPWQVYYGWRHRDGFNDETTRVISIGYRLFRQHGVDYLRAAMGLPKFASDMGIGINFGSYLDYVIKLAEAKISTKTIFDMFATIRDLSLPDKDSMSYAQAFGERADEVIQHWINHPYKVVNGFGNPREIEDDDFRDFLWCSSNSSEAANYALEAISKSEAVWTDLMKSFSSLKWQSPNKKLIDPLFKWLTASPKTRVEQVPGVIKKITSKGYSQMKAFIMEAGQHPKQELLDILRSKGIREALKFIYTKDLGDNLFCAIYDIKKDRHLANICKYEMLSMTRNILNKSTNIDTIRDSLPGIIDRLNYRQYCFMDWLAKQDCPINIELFEHVIKLTANDDCGYEIERVSDGLTAVKNKLHWPKLIRIEANVCRVAGSIFTLQEAETLLDNNASDEVFKAVYNFLGEKRPQSKEAPFLLSRYGPDQNFVRLIKLGADHESLFKLCINGECVNDEFVSFWIKHRNDKIPECELIRQTGWMYSYGRKLKYTSKNCETLVNIIKNHSQHIPTALKAINLDIDFSQTMQLILNNELSEEKITEILLERVGINTKS